VLALDSALAGTTVEVVVIPEYVSGEAPPVTVTVYEVAPVTADHPTVYPVVVVPAYETVVAAASAVGVTAVEAAEDLLSPEALLATTVNVSASSGPENVQVTGSGPEPVAGIVSVNENVPADPELTVLVRVACAAVVPVGNVQLVVVATALLPVVLLAPVTW
jgi:hypothetical protein